jgi:2-keto-4-pentenoate hydratase/2-oxohepta-3-ene-1,7-dioic acid hydratase in catechol pathway
VKLIRFGEISCERPGIIDDAGLIRDLSGVVLDIGGDTLSPESLARIADATGAGNLPVIRNSPRLGPCLAQVGKIVCVGLNYHEHIKEVGCETPKEPILFMKSQTAISGPFDDVILPPDSSAVDWEVELAVVIGSRARRVAPEEAQFHVAGYCIMNDLSERNWQLEGTGQWVKGKSADTFAPIGPWLVTCDAVPNPQSLALQLSVNGVVMQSGNTRDMVFPVAELVSYISRFMTLMPGDVISTGTPVGVGMGRRPPRYLDPGDIMELSISELGHQRQRVVTAAQLQAADQLMPYSNADTSDR